MIYNITPVPKPRQTRSDKWKKRPCVMRYRTFADECRLKNVIFDNYCSVVFYISMPKSWSNKKKVKMNGMPHQQKPDIDNLLKSLLDAVHSDDSHISDIGSIKKRWTNTEGFIVIN